jgi:hypothetical protein
MSRLDVVSEIEIGAPRDVIAAYACDPDNAMSWQRQIKGVEWQTPPPLAVGSRVAFVTRLMGSPVSYVYQIEELVPGERLVMTADEPFTMQTTYTWDDGPGGTRMTLRNRGEPVGYSKLAARLMTRAMRRANRKDLERLKAHFDAS